MFKCILTGGCAVLALFGLSKLDMPHVMPCASSTSAYLCQESQDVENNKNLEGLYQSRAGSFKRFFMKRRMVSQAVGTFFDMRISKSYIKKFLKIYPEIAQHADEFELPIGGITEFDSFNKFFYRRLSPKGFQARPIDNDPRGITSPVDCHLFVVQDLSKNPDFYVKGCKFNLEKFVQDPVFAKEYQNGSLLLCRLGPNDYHRFYFPLDCMPSKPRKIQGVFESVNPIAYTPTVLDSSSCDAQLYRAGIQPLTENERHVITLASDTFGQVLCVVVGAMMVGQMHYTYLNELNKQTIFKKGQEMGYFAFGASTIVLIFKRGAIEIAQEYAQASKPEHIPCYQDVYKEYSNGHRVQYPESKIRMGQKIAQFN